MNTPRRRTSWFVTLPLVGGAVGFLLLVFFPTGKAIRALKEELRIKQEAITAAVSLQPAIVQLEQSIHSAQEYVADWEEKVPSTSQISKMFGQIHEIITQSGARALGFEPQGEISMAAIHRTPVHLEVSGTFREVTHLILKLENFTDSVWVHEAKIERPAAGEFGANGGNVRCQLKLEMFADKLKKSG